MPSVSPQEIGRLPLPGPERVRLVLAPDVAAVHAALHDVGVNSNGELQYIAVMYDRLNRVNSLIDDILYQLSQVALALFPNWYGARANFPEIGGSLRGDLAGRPGLIGRGVLPPWLQAARRLCQRGRAPLPRGFNGSVHAAQLALAIDASPLLIALILHDEDPAAGALLGLARASEWLARHAAARVVVVVPEWLGQSSELDSISFEAVRVLGGPPEVETRPGPRPRIAVAPLIGLPHPLSRGEQMLARRLAQDEMLAGLFQFNIRVETRAGSQYLVDLVWTAGKLVVEVDGYEFHSDRGAFSRDRRRDYELMISGYLVLRLPQDEVVEDVELAVDKIRDVVLYRRASGLPRSENPL